MKSNTSLKDNPMINQLIIIGKDAKKINRLISEYGDKVKQVHFHGKLEDSFTLRKNFRKVVKVFSDSKEEIIRNSRLLKEKKFFVCPEYPVEKREDISVITSMGIAVDLLYRIETIEKGVMLEILDHYLHHRTLTIPVEPFHSILMAKIKDTQVNLWGLYSMLPDLFFYVDDPGMLEGPGQLSNAHYLDMIDWKNSQFKKNTRRNGLHKYFEAIPREHPECMICNQFHFCFSWAKYKRDSCELWQTILGELQTNAREIKNVMNARSA
ncbi:MAG: hypothetical protein GY950_14710 [bacterium]|nr:hypothetical protein [bacterium]